MIIDNTYFKNEIYIPNAKPSVSSNVKSVSIELQSIIDEYTRECLIKCLGYNLFLEFEAVLNPEEDNGLDILADEKWDFLLNGRTYVNSDDETVHWRGIRFKSSSAVDAVYDRSLLAEYTYFFYERNGYIHRSNIGHEIPTAKNSSIATPNMKVTIAWRKFIKLVQGENNGPNIINKSFGLGVDWYTGDEEINLYGFINDINTLVPDTYANFSPKNWVNINQFGI